MARRKYRNTPTEVDGIKFPSKLEAKRWCELKLLDRGGAISELKRQVPFELFGRNGGLICRYRCDFMYRERGDFVVEDTKGMETPEFKIKRNLFADNYPGIELRIVK